MTDTIRYYVDGSNLSPEEYKKVEDLFVKHSYLYEIDMTRPRCLFVFWQEDLPPNELLKLPERCQVRRIQ